MLSCVYALMEVIYPDFLCVFLVCMPECVPRSGKQSAFHRLFMLVCACVVAPLPLSYLRKR